MYVIYTNRERERDEGERVLTVEKKSPIWGDEKRTLKSEFCCVWG